MSTNVNFEAALGVLLLMGTALLLLLLVSFTAYGLVARKAGRALKGALGLLLVLGVYFSLMLWFSLDSQEKVLARGEEKYFCEIDCHLAYSVIDLSRTKTIGKRPHRATAGGVFHVVIVKTRFDETTTSPQRGNSPLTPNPRALTIFDEQNRKYNLSMEGQKALLLSGGGGTPLTAPLRPGESYTTALVFDLPAEVHNPTLLINEARLPTRFIVGHENSFWHRQTKFRLEELAGSSAAR